MAAVVIAVSGPASAGSATVTYSASVTLPAQPSSNFAGAGGGGDGWAVALSATNVYNVFHHQSPTQVECHVQATAAVCPGYPKTITDGSSNNFYTSISPGLYLNQANGKLYVPVVRASDTTAGVLCIDTASASANPFCGFTALAPAGEAQTNGLSNPVQIGTKWYVFNEVSGAPSGAKDKILCFSLKTFTACSGQPYAVGLGGASLSVGSYSAPMGFAGTNLYPQFPGANKLGCFDTLTKMTCTGAWPVSVAGYSSSPFPKLNASGKAVGVCLRISGTPCFTPTGASSPTPAALATAIPSTNYYFDGQPVVIGARVYTADNNANAVECFNFATNQGCPNFPHTFSNLYLLYTVNRDPYRSSCLWVNADQGSAQIQNIDAFSAGACADAPYRVFTAGIVASPHLCIPAKYTSLTITAPAYAAYTSGKVDFQNSNGVPIAGIPTHNLVKGKTSLADLHLSTADKLPQFVISLTGAPANLKSITVKVEWAGKYDESCVKGTTKVLGAGPPGPPIHVGGHVKSVNGHVTWKKPKSDGHSPITGYVVTGFDANGHPVGSCTSTAPKLTCDITSKSHFKLSTIYTFKVVAMNAVGRSGPGIGYSVPAALTSPIVGTKVKVTG